MSVARLFDRLVRLRHVEAWTLILLCTDLAAIGDLLTGPDLWFGPVYLVVICLAAWSLGWKSGQLTGLGCMFLTFAINGINLYPYSAAHVPSNFAVRFIAVSMIVAAIAGVRRTYLKEWWLARTDTLTGALNRQAFFELATSAVDSRRWRLLVYADLDGLKLINDRRGHEAGDAWLRSFATTVRKIIRREDIFARVGGDEFLIFMAVKDEAAAKIVADRLHLGMNSASADGKSLRCSVGALVLAPGQRSIDDLVRRADNLMYQAKLRGASLELAIALDQPDELSAGRARKLERAPDVASVPAPRMTFADRRASAPH